MIHFTRHFNLHRSDVSLQARQYLQGLMQAGNRKNMERMQEVIPDSDYQALQLFISDSPWNAQDVMDEAALYTDKLIGDSKKACLIIDETPNQRKGHKSGGVARQYLGCVGKVSTYLGAIILVPRLRCRFGETLLDDFGEVQGILHVEEFADRPIRD